MWLLAASAFIFNLFKAEDLLSSQNLCSTAVVWDTEVMATDVAFG